VVSTLRLAHQAPRERHLKLPDGLYRVVTPYLCAGFVVKNGRVALCAPILRRRLDYWKTVARRIG